MTLRASGDRCRVDLWRRSGRAEVGDARTTETNTAIKGGKDTTVIGCVERQSHGHYILTALRDSGRGRLEDSWYSLVSNQDLSTHVGERVESQARKSRTATARSRSTRRPSRRSRAA
jgi:hypothetical protein